MILCFDIDRDTKSKLDGLLKIGDYKDYSEILSVSIANQFLLHAPQQSKPEDSQPAAQAAFSPTLDTSPALIQQLAQASAIEAAPKIMSPVFLRDVSADFQIDVAPMPNDVFAPGSMVSADRWIFGQHNKLLPAKVNVRALLNLMLRTPRSRGLDLEEASQEITTSASQLGDQLRAADLRAQRPRDEAFAVAFPSSDSSNSDRSRLRYASQFVGALSKESRMTGLLIDFKFVNVDRNKPPRIRLTEAGLQFARMANPILDSPEPFDPPSKFNEEEISFLIQHVVNNVPVEFFAYSVTLTSIASGANTPDQLDHALKKYLPSRKEKPFTDAFLTTQRAGVIARMADLGLVGRVRSGANVTYVVNEIGSQFVKKGSK